MHCQRMVPPFHPGTHPAGEKIISQEKLAKFQASYPSFFDSWPQVKPWLHSNHFSECVCVCVSLCVCSLFNSAQRHPLTMMSQLTILHYKRCISIEGLQGRQALCMPVLTVLRRAAMILYQRLERLPFFIVDIIVVMLLIATPVALHMLVKNVCETRSTVGKP